MTKKRIITWLTKHTGGILVVLFLIIHLTIINDYGFTWDFHFHFFGGGHLLGYSWQQLEPRPLPYVEPDPRVAWTLPYGPLMSIPPVASFLLLYKTWHLLPADSAYHLPIVFWGIAGIGILYIFMRQAFTPRIALLSALFLALTPRYFGDLHNNMKDVPSAVAFALNIWLLWRLVKFRRPIDLLWAVCAFALAFNVKINSIFIPVIFAVWICIVHIFKLVTRRTPLVFWYFPIAAIGALALWSLFWQHPIAQLDHAYRTFGIGTNNIEVIVNNRWYCSGSTVPWYYPYWYLGITTPIPILIFSLLGIIGTLITFFHPKLRSNQPTKLLILLWLFLPLMRYFIPTIGVIDGVRHFEEVMFPIAALAAIALDATLVFLDRLKKRIGFMLMLGIYAWLSWNIISYHPYQITYFNELVGGVSGAFGKYDLDYWGTSQKAAVEWVNAHAPKNAKIYIVMAPNVAATYLRPDLFTNLNKFGYDESDFVILLNRQSFYYRFFYAYEYLLAHTPTYTVSVQGTPLTWIFDNRTKNRTPRQTPWWQGEDPCILQYWKGNK